MRSSSLVLVAIAAAVVYTAVATPVAAKPGGWQSIPDVNDTHVQEIGAWAVAEHVKRANDGLKFRKVVSGEEQVVSGMNYRLTVVAEQVGGEDAEYTAVVYEQSWTNTRKLLSFGPNND